MPSFSHLSQAWFAPQKSLSKGLAAGSLFRRCWETNKGCVNGQVNPGTAEAHLPGSQADRGTPPTTVPLRGEEAWAFTR